MLREIQLLAGHLNRLHGGLDMHLQMQTQDIHRVKSKKTEQLSTLDSVFRLVLHEAQDLQCHFLSGFE